jgi:hypothetical protein
MYARLQAARGGRPILPRVCDELRSFLRSRSRHDQYVPAIRRRMVIHLNVRMLTFFSVEGSRGRGVATSGAGVQGTGFDDFGVVFTSASGDTNVRLTSATRSFNSLRDAQNLPK